MRTDWNPDSIDWQEVAGDGTKYALLSGRRDLVGEDFSYAFFIPAGFLDPAHWHTQTAHVFVARGSLYLGYGEAQENWTMSIFPQAATFWFPPMHAILTGATRTPSFSGSRADRGKRITQTRSTARLRGVPSQSESARGDGAAMLHTLRARTKRDRSKPPAATRLLVKVSEGANSNQLTLRSEQYR